MRSLKRLNGGVKGYDFEEESAIIFRTLAHEKAVTEAQGIGEWRDILTGVNLVRTDSNLPGETVGLIAPAANYLGLHVLVGGSMGRGTHDRYL